MFRKPNLKNRTYATVFAISAASILAVGAPALAGGSSSSSGAPCALCNAMVAFSQAPTPIPFQIVGDAQNVVSILNHPNPVSVGLNKSGPEWDKVTPVNYMNGMQAVNYFGGSKLPNAFDQAKESNIPQLTNSHFYNPEMLGLEYYQPGSYDNDGNYVAGKPLNSPWAPWGAWTSNGNRQVDSYHANDKLYDLGMTNLGMRSDTSDPWFGSTTIAVQSNSLIGNSLGDGGGGT